MMEAIKKSLQTLQQDYGKVCVFVTSFLLSGICIFFLIFYTTPQKLKVSFLDVGQGDAILIVTPDNHTMLVDGGATNIVLEKLSKQLPLFTKSIDVVVATHPDADHVTGLIPILEKYTVKKIVISPREGGTEIFKDVEKHIEDEDADMHVAKKGDTISFHDGVTAHILYPAKKYIPTKDTNDASVSMVVTYDETSFLLTGDLPQQKESFLLQKNILPRNVTVYKAGHHGSKTSSGEQLLSYTRPEYAVISAGLDNRYGHPNQETLTRLQTYAKEIISTIDRGTISFITNGKTVDVVTTK